MKYVDEKNKSQHVAIALQKEENLDCLHNKGSLAIHLDQIN